MRGARLAAGLLLWAQACAPPTQSAMRVIIRLGPGLRSACVQLTATEGSTTRRTPQRMATAGRTELLVAVAQGSFGEVVTLEAEGFADDGCATLTSPPERSQPVQARFVKGSIPEYVVVLERSSPATEAGACANGLDDDLDGQLDCADLDCAGAGCSTGSLCLADERCGGGVCGGGAPAACPPRASPCFTGSGTCDPSDGGCVYAINAGAACDDGDVCTAPDRCDPAGACAGTPTTCDTPPLQCLKPLGACTQGACSYPPADPGASCDDGDPCTTADGCDGDGGCRGSRVTCTPNDCQLFSHCINNGQCVYDGLAAGTGCDGGVCNGVGACIPRFPYVPSNFTEAEVPTPPPGAVTLSCGLTVIDTQASGPPVVTTSCGPGLQFGARDLPQDGGPSALLLSCSGLQIGAGAELRLVGPRPVIIAALGSVTVLGTLVAESGAAACTAGGAGQPGTEEWDCGGGGGGAFGSVGGPGGPGAPEVGVPAGVGGDGGQPNGVAELVPLRGGCPGGPGGASSSRLASGGGALQISSTSTLSVGGAIAAPGQGGAGGQSALKPSGANGGGSGGGLLLEALLVTVGPGAALTANGGGGGEGASLLYVGAGGDAGELAAEAPAAGGDRLEILGGTGGSGAARDAGAGTGAIGFLAPSAGGGGGGGVGRVRINAQTVSLGSGARLSPAPTCGPDGGCP